MSWFDLREECFHGSDGFFVAGDGCGLATTDDSIFVGQFDNEDLGDIGSTASDDPGMREVKVEVVKTEFQGDQFSTSAGVGSPFIPCSAAPPVRFNQTVTIAMSAGDTPEIRDAWPRVAGRSLVNFWRASLRRLGTVE